MNNRSSYDILYKATGQFRPKRHRSMTGPWNSLERGFFLTTGHAPPGRSRSQVRSHLQKMKRNKRGILLQQYLEAEKLFQLSKTVSASVCMHRIIVESFERFASKRCWRMTPCPRKPRKRRQLQQRESKDQQQFPLKKRKKKEKKEEEEDNKTKKRNQTTLPSAGAVHLLLLLLRRHALENAAPKQQQRSQNSQHSEEVIQRSKEEHVAALSLLELSSKLRI